jgi:1,4-alpha-glucan branching enzyme
MKAQNTKQRVVKTPVDKKSPKKSVGRSAKPQIQSVDKDDAKSLAEFTDFDAHLFREGRHFELYKKLGAHLVKRDDKKGVRFSVWAPNAKEVFVLGDFNNWKEGEIKLHLRPDSSGIWESFVPGVKKGSTYKFRINSASNGYSVLKSDPFAIYAQTAPETASVVWDLDYKWEDNRWMKERSKYNSLDSPMSVYEMHMESWRKVPDEDNRYLTYREMAAQLVPYLKENGFTHVELLPVMEHPFSGSWGYQVLGYFAATSRFGTPQDFMYLIDELHQNNIGVILDWVPSHFPGDEHGLRFFDGTFLFEHEDPKQGYQPDWSSYIFNYGRNEVKEFLISSAHFWLDKYHIDGLRVDAVASMLYLDYSKKEGEWVPNKHGGRENLAAIQFLREMNESVYEKFEGIQTIAEESTAWPMVTRPIYTGGLGFGMKWSMGWMHDTLDYFNKESIHRSYHHNQITFSIMYTFNENFMLSISHDEVVHGKDSMINKMPGDTWQKFANLRALYGYMFGHPGKKLNFMGSEFGQYNEWNYQQSLDWHLLDFQEHKGLLQWIKDLNNTYIKHPALWENDFDSEGFQWIDANDSEKSILSFVRYSKDKSDSVIIICNLTPTPRYNYRIGIPEEGYWHEILNSDAKNYGGSGQGNFGGLESAPVPYHNEMQSLNLVLPPLGTIMLSRNE